MLRRGLFVIMLALATACGEKADLGVPLPDGDQPDPTADPQPGAEPGAGDGDGPPADPSPPDVSFPVKSTDELLADLDKDAARPVYEPPPVDDAWVGAVRRAVHKAGIEARLLARSAEMGGRTIDVVEAISAKHVDPWVLVERFREEAPEALAERAAVYTTPVSRAGFVVERVDLGGIEAYRSNLDDPKRPTVAWVHGGLYVRVRGADQDRGRAVHAALTEAGAYRRAAGRAPASGAMVSGVDHPERDDADPTAPRTGPTRQAVPPLPDHLLGACRRVARKMERLFGEAERLYSTAMSRSGTSRDARQKQLRDAIALIRESMDQLNELLVLMPESADWDAEAVATHYVSRESEGLVARIDVLRGKVLKALSDPSADDPFADDPFRDGFAKGEFDDGPSKPRAGGPAAEDEMARTGGAFAGRDQARSEAVLAALRWLAAHQSADGAWDAGAFGQWCHGKRQTAPATDDKGKPAYTVGTTGLALQAFLGAGFTHRGTHPFRDTVARGLRRLRDVQDADGCIGPRSSPQFVYNHAAGALAMVEAYGMTGSPVLEASAQRALHFIDRARNPFFAWRYGVKPGDNDTSVTGSMMMPLKAAKLVNEYARASGAKAPFTFDDEALDGIAWWLEKMTDPDYGRVGYVRRGSGPARPKELVDRFPAEKSEAMTAIGVLARAFLIETPADERLVPLGAKLLRALPPAWNPRDGSIDMYYWYFGTLAMFQIGGDDWRDWNEALQKALLGAQRKDTDPCRFKGSWDPIGPWGADGGRVYSTAILAMCLQASHRYPRSLYGH